MLLFCSKIQLSLKHNIQNFAPGVRVRLCLRVGMFVIIEYLLSLLTHEEVSNTNAFQGHIHTNMKAPYSIVDNFWAFIFMVRVTILICAGYLSITTAYKDNTLNKL